MPTNQRLEFARRVLNKAQFDKLYRAYRRLFRFQIAPVILLAAVVLLELILIPSEAVPKGYASAKETVILFETAFFIVPFYPVWLIVSQFAVGRLWHKYCRWYDKSEDRNGVYALFDEKNKHEK
mgnify:FL=1